ncbi:hypothetical protein H4W79_000657 [Nocardiopsis terrae]|uniref:TIGR04086 family membrane protein n=1 Tax=Nocardiopsis terrae TaxID=372655 RepID=A0ABR9HBQ4_9ACTN|nr:hypothetical protein [Nocardiopsis terrae]MBE1456443.1 hypothetical protein [Nocardiopsis terrae]
MTTPETAQTPQSRPRPFVSSAVTVLSFAVLFVAGLTVGVLSGFGVGWLAHFWNLGAAVKAGSVVAVLAFLVLLYAVCRLAGWGSRRQSGALGFAVGYVTALLGMLGYLPGGDIVFSAKLVNYLFLFGSMAALAAGVVRSVVLPARPAPAPQPDRAQDRP